MAVYRADIIEGVNFRCNIPDVTNEENYRDLWLTLEAFFAGSGFTKTTDPMYNPVGTAYMRANMKTDQTNFANKAMDGVNTTGTGAKSPILPTVGQPYKLLLDAGAPGGVANLILPLSVRLPTYTNVFDPKTYTMAYYDTVVIDPVTGVWSGASTPILASGGGAIPDLTASNVGFQALTAPAAGHRYIEFTFPNTQGAASYVQIPEIEIYTGAANTNKVAALVATGPGTGTSTQTGNVQFWKAPDWITSNGMPLILKVTIGSGTVAGAIGFWCQAMTATDGFGNVAGSAQYNPVGSMQSWLAAATSINTYYRNFCNGNVVNTSAVLNEARIGFALCYNFTNGGIGFTCERNHNIDGTDDYTTDDQSFHMNGFGSSSSYKNCFAVPKTGAIPAVQTDTCMTLGSDGTNISSRGSKMGPAAQEPFLGYKLLPIRSCGSYWSGEGTQEKLMTVNLYGASESIFPMGNANFNGCARGSNSASRLWMLRR